MTESVLNLTLLPRKPVADPTGAEYLRVVALFVGIAVVCVVVLWGLL
jgi:hypothetical protein